MAFAYKKNRNVMENDIEKMELAIIELKNAREKLNMKKLGNLNNVEKEMEDMCNFVSDTGKIHLSRLNSVPDSHKSSI